MALVDYASSDEDVEASQTLIDTPASSLKRKRDEDLPPLPSKFHDLYASTTRVSTQDDPSLHGGRKRVIPHIEGNWPTHLYIEWYPLRSEHDSLAYFLSKLSQAIKSHSPTFKICPFLISELGAPLPLHVSLSRPIGFSTEQKDDFGASLERAIKASSIRPFNISFKSLDWVANFENSRWFLVLRLQIPDGNGLNKLLHVSNKVVQEYGQPPLYAKSSKAVVDNKTENSRPTRGERKQALPNNSWDDLQDLSDAFHFSIAWTLEAPSRDIQELTDSIMKSHFEDVEDIRINVEEIKSKVGNAVTSIPLPKNVMVGKSLFGV